MARLREKMLCSHYLCLIYLLFGVLLNVDNFAVRSVGERTVGFRRAIVFTVMPMPSLSFQVSLCKRLKFKR
jgi:hypothetical protein